MSTMINILSIDGGGIRGVIPARIIIELENIIRVKTNKDEVHIAEYFDLIAGTSTGGILALLYCLPNKVSSSEVLNLYYQNGNKIFSSTFFKKITCGLFGEKYDNKNLEKILRYYFDNMKLSDLSVDCLIPAFDIEHYRSIFFTKPNENTEKDFYLVDVLLSTSAAPTFFEPHEIYSTNLKNHHVNLDGGVFANNPAMCALVEACKQNQCNLNDVNVLSIGTGMKCEESLAIPYKKAKKWGLLSWISPLINILMYSTSNIVHHQLKILYSYLDSDYYRLQPVFSEIDMNDISLNMDDASKNNIEALLMKTEKYILENYGKFIIIADELIKAKENKN